MNTQFTRRRFLQAAGGSAAGAALLGAAGCGGGGSGGGGAQVTLRLSHQWPQATSEAGDFRALIAQRFADQVAKQTNGEVEIKVYPNASLVEPEEQSKAIGRGALDMSVFPLDYASGEAPEFSVTLMPSLVKSHAQAQKWPEAEIGQRVTEMTERHGIKILTWVWNAGGIGVHEGKPVVAPKDVSRGAVARAAGPWVERMLKSAGYSITSMPSSEIYNAMQTGVLDVAVTSASSFCSYRLHEQVESYTSPTGNTFWFMFEPLIMGKKQFDELGSDVQKVVEEVGAGLQQFAYDASEQDDAKCEKTFSDAGVTVAQIDDASFQEWQRVSEPIWAQFGKEVQGGKELIDLALEVPDE
ncbi:MAG: C4-dicarboxylate ABC transporter substrate-binding protein [Streptosporangiales bacterium]|nr:C4-dicarboxylate ABC transporter substrate-binding protein [Streptosporangiales bacterium]